MFNAAPALGPLFPGEPDSQVFADAVTRREPDWLVPQSELAPWLALQERLELRRELAAAGLL